MKKAQSAIEYSFLISLVIVAFLAMQVYLARSMQGNLQGGRDNLFGNQYGHGVSDVDERIHGQSRTFELTIPGFRGAPHTFIRSRGSTSSKLDWSVAPLEETWP